MMGIQSREVLAEVYGRDDFQLLLFSIYTESMLMEAVEGMEDGVKVGGRLVKDVRLQTTKVC